MVRIPDSSRTSRQVRKVPEPDVTSGGSKSNWRVRCARAPASRSRAYRTVYEHVNWEGVIDHVGAVVLVVLVRLDPAVRVPGARQQRVLPWLLRSKPIEFPTPPRMSSHGVQEF